MKRVLKHGLRLWRSKFARSVALVASGTAAAQVIGIAFSPIITRLYGPESFGILGTYLALLAILAPLAALSYPIAIVLPKHDNNAKGLVKLSLRLSFVTSGVVATVILFFEEPLLELLNIGEVGKFIWFVPLALLFSVWLAVAKQWAIRKKLFKLKAKVAVVNALLQNGFKSGIGLFAPFAWVLITIATLGSILNAVLYYLGFRKEPSSGGFQKEGALSQTQLAREYRDFAYFRTPQLLLNAASHSMPILMLTTLFGPAIAGFYTLGKMVLGAPVQLLGQSVAAVFYPKFNETILRGESGKKLLVDAGISLGVIGFVPFSLIFIFGPFIFGMVFGPEWVTAGEFARWLALSSFFSYLNRPSVAAIPVLRMQRFYLVFEITGVIIRLLSLVVAYVIFNTAVSAIIMFSLANVVLSLSLMFITLYAASKKGTIT
ncbi:MAG: oligosaccharide flippase family protein [Idiomarina sp.]|nr:oligosaccharide flippase family protein [Idiomarina sp.]